MKKLRLTVIGIAAAGAVGAFAGLGNAHAVPAKAPAPGPAPASSIKVHGRWTIVVRDRHGHVVTVRRFENSLTTDGAGALVKLLGRSSSMGRWAVELNASNVAGTPHPCNNAGVQICWITTEADNAFNGFVGPVTKNLVVTVSTSPAKLTLTGSVPATMDATVGQVVTGIALCSSSTLPAACTNASPSLFSIKGLSPGVNVVAGQTIAVTVSFTFS